jgi:hypothetical protein
MSTGGFLWSVLRTRPSTVGRLPDKQFVVKRSRSTSRAEKYRMFHAGDLQSGIALAVQQAKSVLCFVEGGLPESKIRRFGN